MGPAPDWLAEPCARRRVRRVGTPGTAAPRAHAAATCDDYANQRDAQNQSHGASLGGKLRRFCNGTRFRCVFR